MLALEVDILSDEEFLRIGRETKSIQEVVIRLLELGRVDEAVQDASQVDGWQLVKLADIFSLYEKLDETEQWTTYIAWLRKRHSRLHTLKEELAAAGL